MNGDVRKRELLKEFLNFCLRLTKENHIAHTIILTSNTIFVDRLYNYSKLKKASDFWLIDHPSKEVAVQFMKDLGFNKKQIDLILEYYGTMLMDILSVFNDIGPKASLKVLKEYFDRKAFQAFGEIRQILIEYANEQYLRVFKKIAREIVKKGVFTTKSLNLREDSLLAKVISIFAEREILFYNPLDLTVKANSQIYAKGMEILLKIS